jgi:hypothetical protein
MLCREKTCIAFPALKVNSQRESPFSEKLD